jgi:hypothetical protein
VRFTPIVLGLVISFASDTRYSLNDVRETLPGYLALLSHILLTGALEHLRSMLVPSVGAKYVSVCYTVGAATFSLIVYVAREVFVSLSVTICMLLASCTTCLRQTCHHFRLCRCSLFWLFLWRHILLNASAAQSKHLSLLRTTTCCLQPLHSLQRLPLDLCGSLVCQLRRRY